jgi:hypothetical protein
LEGFWGRTDRRFIYISPPPPPSLDSDCLENEIYRTCTLYIHVFGVTSRVVSTLSLASVVTCAVCVPQFAVSGQPKCGRTGQAMTSFDNVPTITKVCDGEGFTGPRLCSPEFGARLLEFLPTVNRCVSYRVSRKDPRNYVGVSVERPRGIINIVQCRYCKEQ